MKIPHNTPTLTKITAPSQLKILHRNRVNSPYPKDLIPLGRKVNRRAKEIPSRIIASGTSITAINLRLRSSRGEDIPYLMRISGILPPRPALWNLRFSAQFALCVPISASQLECPLSVDELNLRHHLTVDRQGLLEHGLRDHGDVHNRSPRRTTQPCLAPAYHPELAVSPPWAVPLDVGCAFPPPVDPRWP